MDNREVNKSILELSEFGRRLAMEPDSEALFQRAVESICQFANAQACGIWELSEKLRLHSRAWYAVDTIPLPQPPDHQRWLLRMAQEPSPISLTSQQARRVGLPEALKGSVVVFPLRKDEHLSGIILIAGRKGQTFSELEMGWLGVVIAQLELSMRATDLRDSQQRLKDQLRRATSRLDNLVPFSQDTNQFLSRIAEMVLELSRADQSFIWLMKEERLKLIASAGRNGGKHLAVNRSSAASLAKEAVDTQTYCGWRENGGVSAGSALALPLRGRSGALGAISLYWAEPQAYGDVERDILVSFASQVEAAVENTHLQQAGERTLVQLAELSGASARMVSSPDMPDLMRTIARTISSALHMPMLGVAIIQSDGRLTLDLHGCVGISEQQAREIETLPNRHNVLYHALHEKTTLISQAETPQENCPLGQTLNAASVACAPLVAGGEVLGALFIAYQAQHAFQSTELSLLSAYANQAALAMRTITLRDNLTKHLDRLATFQEFARTLAASLDMEQTLQTILESAQGVLETEAACVMMRDAKQGKLTLQACRGATRKTLAWAEREAESVERGLPTLTLEQDRILTSKDLARDGRNPNRHLPDGPVSAMFSPLKAKGKPFGVLCLYTSKRREFTESDKRLLSMLADGAGIALENARLYEEEKERAAFLSTMVQEVNHRIRNSLQTLAGLLEVELTAPDRSLVDALRKSIERIHCVAHMHGALSQRELQQVEMKENIQRLAEIARRSAGRTSGEILLHISGARLVLPSQKATSLSLAVNELIDNAFQHGLQARTTGKINISIALLDTTAVITISDDGIGLPEGFDLGKDAGIGLKIAAGVAQVDLGGKLCISRTDLGTRAQIKFPI